jgi:cephalosporin hydroxylase
MCDLLGNGRIVTIDALAREGRPVHPRVTYLTGLSTDPAILAEVRSHVRPGDRVLVLLDSDHSERNVLAELRAYQDLVSPGSYCVVEDSNVNGHPVAREHGPGPMEAIRVFLRENTGFQVDRDREKFFLTFNPSGFLKRVE